MLCMPPRKPTTACCGPGHYEICPRTVCERVPIRRARTMALKETAPITWKTAMRLRQTKGKSFRPFKKSYCTNARLRLPHTDVCGLLLIKSLRHAINFFDVRRRSVVYDLFVYFYKCKFEVDERVRDFVEYVEQQTGETNKHLRSDIEGKYDSRPLIYYVEQRGIVSEKRKSYPPEKNGVVEWTNSFLMDTATSMMHCMPVPTMIRAEAIGTAAHIRNITPSFVVRRKTPKTLWSASSVTRSHCSLESLLF